MKKISLFSIIFILSLLFAGCEKGIPEEPIVGSKPSIEVTVSPVVDSIPFGGSASLNYVVKNVSNGDSFTVNGVSTPFSGNINISTLKKDTSFSFFAKNKFGQTTETKKILVKKEVVTLPLPTMILSVTPSTLPVGGGVATISWITTNASIVYYNGIGYGPTQFVSTDWIYKDTVVSLMVVGAGGSKTFSSSIKVEEPPDPLVVLFGKMIGSWKFNQMMESLSLTSIIWENVTLSSYDLDNIWIFNLNHTAMIDEGLLRPDNLNRFVNFLNWNLEPDSTISGFIGPIRKLSYVDENHLNLIYESTRININPDGTCTTTPRLVKEMFIKQ
jgi:hypothetical protein